MPYRGPAAIERAWAATRLLVIDRDVEMSTQQCWTGCHVLRPFRRHHSRVDIGRSLPVAKVAQIFTNRQYLDGTGRGSEAQSSRGRSCHYVPAPVGISRGTCKMKHSPPLVSQILTVPSNDADARRVESREKATEVKLLLWPSSVFRHLPLLDILGIVRMCYGHRLNNRRNILSFAQAAHSLA